MRIRKANAVLAISLVVGGGLLFYLVLPDNTNRPELLGNPEGQKVPIRYVWLSLQESKCTYLDSNRSDLFCNTDDKKVIYFDNQGRYMNSNIGTFLQLWLEFFP